MMCKEFVQEAPEAHSMPEAVRLMIKGLLYAGHFTLHDDKAFDQAYFAHLMVLFRVCTSCPRTPRPPPANLVGSLKLVLAVACIL